MISGFQGQSSTKWPELEPGQCIATVFGPNRGIIRRLIVRIESSQTRGTASTDSWTLSPNLGNAYNARPAGEPFVRSEKWTL